MIGGFLQVIFGWRANFIFLSLLSLTALMAFLRIPETNQHKNPDQIKPEYLIKVYQLLFTHASFVGYCLCIMFAMVGYFAWILALPIYIIKHLKYSPDQLGVMMLIVSSSSIFIGSVINRYCIKRYPTNSILVLSWCCLMIAACLPSLCYQYWGFSAYWIYPCMWLYLFLTAYLWPNIYTKAFDPFQHLAGQASSIYGNAYTMGSFFSAILIGYASEATPYGLCAILFAANAGSLIIYFWRIHPHQRSLQEFPSTGNPS